MTLSLVTGGAGFIGSHIVRQLLARGQRVRVFDNFSTGKMENLAEVADEIEIITGDLRKQSDVAEAVLGVEYIYHQAAFVSVPLSVEQPQTCFDINVQGTLNLLEAANRAGVQRVVLASSAAVYGESTAYPLREDSLTMSMSPYAASKRVNEIYADLYTRTTEMGVTALRYFNVYGPRQALDSDYAAAISIFSRLLVDNRVSTIYGDGLQTRDFVFVADVVRANILAIGTPGAAGKTINICTGEEITILDLVNVMREILPDAPEPVFAPPRSGDIYRSVGDATLAAEVLEFVPEVGLGEGLKQTVDWMRS